MFLCCFLRSGDSWVSFVLFEGEEREDDLVLRGVRGEGGEKCLLAQWEMQAEDSVGLLYFVICKGGV